MSYHGGQAVNEGLYLNCSSWEFESVTKEGGILPGAGAVRYVKLPLSAAMVVGPLIGLAYVILLSVAFFPVLGYLLACRAGQALKRMMIGTHRHSWR